MTPAHRALLAVVLASAGCASATDCATSIPEDLRADALRYALDQNLIDRFRMPRAAVDLAYAKGAPYAGLTEDRRRVLAPYAVGYASCIQERVDRN